MVISWKPPLDSGGVDVSNYIIEKRDTNRDMWTTVTSATTKTTCKVCPKGLSTKIQSAIIQNYKTCFLTSEMLTCCPFLLSDPQANWGQGIHHENLCWEHVRHQWPSGVRGNESQRSLQYVLLKPCKHRDTCFSSPKINFRKLTWLNSSKSRSYFIYVYHCAKIPLEKLQKAAIITRHINYYKIPLIVSYLMSHKILSLFRFLFQSIDFY